MCVFRPKSLSHPLSASVVQQVGSGRFIKAGIRVWLYWQSYDYSQMLLIPSDETIAVEALDFPVEFTSQTVASSSRGIHT
jgi:hypothetical protein